MFKRSFRGGTVYHLIGSMQKDAQGNPVQPSGYKLWQNFLKWCNAGGRKDALISKIKSDLKAIVLDGDHANGFAYVNHFITKHNELDALGASVPDNTMMSDFGQRNQSLESKILQVNRGTHAWIL